MARAQKRVKEVAALYLPPIPKNISIQNARVMREFILEEVSTRFNLISQSKVNNAYKLSTKSLQRTECTEDNCIAKMQKIISKNF